MREAWDDQEREIGEEYLAHARAIRAEREAARREGREPQLIRLLQHWGGVTIAYRRRLVDSPSYTLNHEEVEKALEEGIVFAESLTPSAVDVDNYGAVKGMRFKHESGEKWLPAHSVFVAAGTQPNTVLAREDAAHFVLDGKYFAACDEEGAPVKPERSTSKPETPNVLIARQPDGRFVSYFGDVHPSFFGNVVKAMGSAKQGYPVVSRVLGRRAPQLRESSRTFFGRVADQLVARVERVERLTPNIVEVVVRAPLAAAKFQPGQFYRLQNFESLAPVAAGTRMQMEGLALTGAWVDRDKGPRLDHRPGDGRVLRPLRHAAEGRARDPHGPDRHADGNRSRRNRGAVRRRTGQRGAVLDRPGVSRRRLQRCSTSPATRRRSTATRSTKSRMPPTW